MVLGVLVLLISLAILLPVFLDGGSTGTGGASLNWILAAISVIYGSLGAAWILASIFVRKRRRWAIIVGIVLTSLALLFTGLGLIANLIGAASGQGNALALFISFAFVAAFTQLIVQLSRCFAIIRREEEERGVVQRGFEPVLEAQRVDPAE